MSDALMDLHAHYKAVRARLNGGQPSKQAEIIELPVVEPDPPAAPPLEMLRTYGPDLLRGLHASKEVREKILPILEKHRINWIDVVGKSQKWKYTKCRFEVFAKLNAHGWSLSRIGSLCGDRDHTTVLSGINRFLKENLTEAEIAVAKDCGVRVVDYYENKMVLIECERMEQ